MSVVYLENTSLFSAVPFDNFFEFQGNVFKEIQNRRTLCFERDGKRYFIKCHEGVGWKEIFKNLLRGCLPVVSAKNEWLAIKRLQQLSISTMTPVVFGEKGLNPASRRSFILTKAIEPATSLESLTCNWGEHPPPFPLKRTLIKRVARIASRLHNAGVNHRDFYLCHFLLGHIGNVTKEIVAQADLYVIDLHRVQCRKKIPERWRIKDIGGLYFSAMNIGLTQSDKLYFMKYYFGGSLKNAMQHERFWQSVHRRAVSLAQPSSPAFETK